MQMNDADAIRESLLNYIGQARRRHHGRQAEFNNYAEVLASNSLPTKIPPQDTLTQEFNLLVQAALFDLTILETMPVSGPYVLNEVAESIGLERKGWTASPSS